MDQYLYTPLSTLILTNDFTLEDYCKVKSSGISEATNPSELWAQYYVTAASNMDEFLNDRTITNLRLRDFVRGIIERVIQITEGPYFDASVSEILNTQGFTQEQIDKVVSVDINLSLSPLELWAHWFATYALSMDEFISDLNIQDRELIIAIEEIISDVNSLLEADLSDI